jgi:carboxyl-terminal processing protease
MSLKVRSILVVVVGTVLGLTVSIGGTLLAELQAQRVARQHATHPHEYVELLAEVIDRVSREYVDRIDDRQLIEGAIRGMIEELDAHSRFLDAEEYEDIRISTTGNYTGVGLDVSLDEGRVMVVSPLDGAPADRAGILPGDIVVSVDDMPIDGENVEDAVSRMRGLPGTEVTLDVLREGNDEPLRFALTRRVHQAHLVFR